MKGGSLWYIIDRYIGAECGIIGGYIYASPGDYISLTYGLCNASKVFNFSILLSFIAMNILTSTYKILKLLFVQWEGIHYNIFSIF